ncbi:hypothetical protein BaRGS_00003086 [Batillaria attramentaria]|uniref:Apple domain-containing protein n=1 Tax=Batillaria attramentaria TaxID=370345 RepID=A0ABD0M2L9_9CAEN
MALVRRRITRKSTSILPVLFLAHFLTGAESRYVLWSLIHDSSVNATALPAGVKLASVTACARACWPDEGCEKFCYDVSEATCYMSGLLMTSEEPEPDMQCYKIYRELSSYYII